MLKRANECITSGSEARPVELVFDEFWRRGEVAMMFGEHGSGKSFLAIQIADALASGRGIGSFRLESNPGKVLYVDLAMNDEQFVRRYMWEGYRGKEQPYTFSSRLYRDRPPTEDDLIPWLFEQVEAEKIKYVIIDDLSAVMRTCDGTRETLNVMRQLRRLRDRFGLSILVLVPSAAPGRDGIVREADLGGQRALCRLADSVFAIARHTKQREWRYLIQTRCRNAPLAWTSHNAMWATLGENMFRLMGLNFEDRTTEEEKRLICEVYSAKSRGLTFREIAKEMGISKSRASRLHQRWNMTIAGWGSGGVKDEGGRIKDEGGTGKDEGGRMKDEGGRMRNEGRAYDDLLDTKAEDACGIRSELDDIIDGVANGERSHCDDEPEEDDPVFADDELSWVEVGEGTGRNYPRKTRNSRIAEYDDIDFANAPDHAAGDGDGSPFLPVGFPPARDRLAGMETELSPTKKIRHIEERHENGKPKIWYQYDGGTLRKYVHDGWGTTVGLPDAETGAEQVFETTRRVQSRGPEY